MNYSLLRHKSIDGKVGNKGFSLVELIVVMSIMTIVVGVLSLGIAMMFSKDADSVATTIADSLTKARTYSMTKPGDFTLTIHLCESGSNQSSDINYNYITLVNDIPSTDSGYVSETILFDASAQICIPSSTDYDTPSDGDEIIIKFNKTNGSVKSIKDAGGFDGSDITSSEIYSLKCIASRNASKTAVVKLMTVTGRNSVNR